MPSSRPASSVQQARQALADRLREIRERAGLRGNELAERAGWHQTKVSKLEHCVTSPSVEDIRVWALICGAPELTEDLIASAQAVNSAYVEWKRRHRRGVRQVQESYIPLWERITRFRIYEAGVIPGIFQVRGYAEAMLRSVITFNKIPDDLEDAVTARLDRRRVVNEGHRTFSVIIEEQVLRTRYGSRATMAEQLSHLLAMMAQPNVSLGIIPSSAPRNAMWQTNGFWIYDTERVITELLTAEITVTQPSEVAVYERAFTVLTAMAVHGADARALLLAALSDLR